MDLEQYLVDELRKGIIDFSLRANLGPDAHPTFYIHPTGKDGTTTDYIVIGNQLIPRFTDSPVGSRV